MKKENVLRGVYTFFLLLMLLPFLSSAYNPGGLTFYLVVGAVQAILIGVAAWLLARRRSVDPTSLVPAILLLANWSVVSIALNMDAPPHGQEWLATITDQQIRYGALIIGSLICFGGLTVLASRLRDERQSVLASLGFACFIISTVLFVLLFLAYPIVATFRFEQEAMLGEPPPWWALFFAYLRSIELVHRLCAYLGTILFVIALRRCGLIGRGSCIGVGGITLFAGIVSTVIHLPPAAAFVPPYLIGVSLLAGMRKNKQT